MLSSWPPLDKNEERKLLQLQRKARDLESRRERILKSKPRAIGIDVQGLDEQVRDKQRRLENNNIEHKETEILEEEVRKIMVKVAEAEDQDHKDIHMNLTKTWEIQKDRTNRPEFDINDPNQKKTERFDWESCGTSSAQKFEGDITRGHIKEAIKARQKEQDDMLQHQLWEREQAQRQDKNDEDQAAKNWQEQYELRKLIEERESEERLRNNSLYMQWNKALSEERQKRQVDDAKRSEDEARHEHEVVVNSPWLREDRNKALSLSGKRVIRSEWKGMTPEQIQQIHFEQKVQMEDSERKRELEREMERDYAEQQRVIQEIANNAHNEDMSKRQQERMLHLQVIKQQRAEYEEKKRIAAAERQVHGFNNWWPFGKDGR